MDFQPNNIRYPRTEEAFEILELVWSCFPENYLVYSIYQTKESIRHIQFLIGQQKSGIQKEILKVFNSNDTLLGFYIAKVIGDVFFLNYIGTKSPSKRNGVGTSLFQDFHIHGLNMGFQKFQLDVYASNVRAYEWYLKHGFRQSTTSYNLAFKCLNPFEGIDNPFFEKHTDSLAKKSREEALTGFSKIKLEMDESKFEIMMIGGKTLRFQNLVNINEDEVLNLIAGSPLKTRQLFLFTGRPEYQGINQLYFSEKVIRMYK